MAVFTPTDRPKSVHNRCVIKDFGGVCVLSRCFLGLFYECRGFSHRTESDLFLFAFSTLWLLYTFPILTSSYFLFFFASHFIFLYILFDKGPLMRVQYSKYANGPYGWIYVIFN